MLAVNWLDIEYILTHSTVKVIELYQNLANDCPHVDQNLPKNKFDRISMNFSTNVDHVGQNDIEKIIKYYDFWLLWSDAEVYRSCRLISKTATR